MSVRLISYGRSNGSFTFPEDVTVIDMAMVADPAGKYPKLDGRATEVQQYLKASAVYDKILERVLEKASDGAVIAFEDSGGKFRSVGMAELMTTEITTKLGLPVDLFHVDLDKETVPYEREIKGGPPKDWAANHPGYAGEDFGSMSDDGEEDSFDAKHEQDIEACKAAFKEEPSTKTAAAYLRQLVEYVTEGPGEMDEVAEHVDPIATWLEEQQN